jgi:hypothetical protein
MDLWGIVTLYWPTAACSALEVRHYEKIPRQKETMYAIT